MALLSYNKAYIPLRRKIKPIFHCGAKLLALGPGIGLDPQCDDFALPISTCWYLKNAKTLRYPTRNPNASQWNIGCIGSRTENTGVGHVHFMSFVLISFALGSQREPLFQWNMGLRLDNTGAGVIEVYPS